MPPGRYFRLSLTVHEPVFVWILALVEDHGLLSGKAVGIDSTLLEASR